MQPTTQVRRVTLWALLVNVALAGLKMITGLTAASQALVADAVHSLSDTSTDFAVLIGVRYWSAPADVEHPHGHGRIEILITFFIGLVLAIVGLQLARHAIITFPQPHDRVPGWSALAVALISIICKEGMYQWTAAVGERIHSSALIANAWHHRSDALSSLPVAIAVLGTRCNHEWHFLDHLATVIVALLIIYAAVNITRPALHQLIDTGLNPTELATLQRLIKQTPGVKDVHALRTRHIGSGIQIDLHVMVDPKLSVAQGHCIAHQVKERLLQQGPNIVDVLVHIEPFGN